jgi:hypothetical protein
MVVFVAHSCSVRPARNAPRSNDFELGSDRQTSHPAAHASAGTSQGIVPPHFLFLPADDFGARRSFPPDQDAAQP